MEKYIAKLTKEEVAVIEMAIQDKLDAGCDDLESDVADEALYSLDGIQGKMDIDGFKFAVIDLNNCFDKAQINVIIDALKQTMKKFPAMITLNASANDPEYVEAIQKFREFLPVPEALQTFLDYQQGKPSRYEEALESVCRTLELNVWSPEDK